MVGGLGWSWVGLGLGLGGFGTGGWLRFSCGLVWLNSGSVEVELVLGWVWIGLIKVFG